MNAAGPVKILQSTFKFFFRKTSYILWYVLAHSRDAVKNGKHFSNTCIAVKYFSQKVTRL